MSISLVITLLFNISPSIASRSNFPHTLRMKLARRISKKYTPMRMRPFEKIPLLSRQRRRRTGRPNPRSILHPALLSNNVKTRSSQRSRPSKPMVEMPRTRTMRRTKSNGISLSRVCPMPSHVMHALACVACSCVPTLIHKRIMIASV